jgi:carbon-monoxide dehydrogenase large subunit
MPNYYATPILPLASKKVRYVGEAVVAIVATSRYLAEDALELIDVEYEPLGAISRAELAVAAGAPLLHEEAGTNVLIAREFKKGNVAADLDAAAVRVGGRFEMTRKAPLAMEPRSYSAEYEKRRDAITLYTSSNIPGIVRDAISESLSLPGHRLRVVAPDVGGSFGSKGSLYPEELLICIVALKLRRSVKWTADRLEDVSSSSQAFGEIVDAEMGFDAKGVATSLQADVIGDVGAFSIYPWTCGLEPVQVVSFLPGPYKIGSYRGAVRGVATCKPPTGPYRGVGRPISTFVAERLMDMGAKALGIDPLEIRRRNLVQPEEFPYRIASGIIWDKTGFVECLEAAAKAAGYDQLRAEQATARKQGRLFGIGIASYAELTGIGSRIAVAPGMPINTGSETAKITIDSTGGITAAFGVASHGQGLETTLAQIVADDLGARFEDVRVIQGDSDEVPMSTGTYASRSAVLGGGAAKHASKILQEKIKRVASYLLEANADDIELTEGNAVVLGTDRTVSFKQIAKAVYSDMKTLPVEAREELSATYTYDPINGTTAAATHIAAVEIDPVTCFVKILKFVVAEDCGRVINPMIVDGQVHGGVAQGIGAALFEELIYDENGQLLSASLVDYVIPSAPEVPLMDVVHVESESAVAGGFRGMGEGGTIGAPAALANAIADALSPFDIDVSILPMTPERIFKLIQNAQFKAKGKADDLSQRTRRPCDWRRAGCGCWHLQDAGGTRDERRRQLSQFEGRG